MYLNVFWPKKNPFCKPSVFTFNVVIWQLFFAADFGFYFIKIRCKPMIRDVTNLKRKVYASTKIDIIVN